MSERSEPRGLRTRPPVTAPRRRRPPADRRRSAGREHRRLSGLAEVARREFASRVRSKGFVIGLVATSLAIVALVVVPTLDDGDDRYTVGLAGAGAEVLAEPLAQVARASGVDLSVHEAGTGSRARSQVREGEYDAAVIGRTLVTRGDPDPRLTSVVQTASQAVALEANLARAGLSAAQAREVLSVEPLRTEVVGGGGDAERTRQGVAIVMMLSLLLLLMTSSVGVAIGVVEEKGSRIVEILLATLRPRELLGGKLLAYGVLGGIQLAAFAASGLVAASVVGLTDDLPQGWGTIAASAVAGYLLGFLFFASLAAALAALVSRQEELNAALGPMNALMVCTYLGAFLAMQEPDSTLGQALSVIPPFSSMVMPVRAATWDVPPWQVLLSVALMLAAVAVIVVAGGVVYERSVLRTGSKVRLADALRAR